MINSLLDEDCWQLIVPAKVYHAMQKRGRCCGCFPNVVDIILSAPGDAQNPYAVPTRADSLAGLPPALILTAARPAHQG